ncbi:hypothetical protein VNO78_17275 [Psophocarpus tetragonolobus]|uniref:Uncharacterized protein n=1 Tax=Psophocarpus tetragonolobus TaxID=3891 RepID=A0AAN9XL00_PSOTE
MKVSLLKKGETICLSWWTRKNWSSWKSVTFGVLIQWKQCSLYKCREGIAYVTVVLMGVTCWGKVGSFVNMDNDTMLQRSLDVVRMFVVTTEWNFINVMFRVKINEMIFAIKLVEEVFYSTDILMDYQKRMQVKQVGKVVFHKFKVGGIKQHFEASLDGNFFVTSTLVSDGANMGLAGHEKVVHVEKDMDSFEDSLTATQSTHGCVPVCRRWTHDHKKTYIHAVGDVSLVRTMEVVSSCASGPSKPTHALLLMEDGYAIMHMQLTSERYSGHEGEPHKVVIWMKEQGVSNSLGEGCEGGIGGEKVSMWKKGEGRWYFEEGEQLVEIQVDLASKVIEGGCRKKEVAMGRKKQVVKRVKKLTSEIGCVKGVKGGLTEVKVRAKTCLEEFKEVDVVAQEI